MYFPLRSSSLRCYLECPRKAYYSYVEGLQTMDTPSMAIGTATHETAAWMLMREIETHALPTVEEVKDKAYDCAHTIAYNVDFTSALEEKSKFEDRVIGLSTQYRHEVAPWIQPLEVEASFTLEIQGLTLLGTIDVVGQDGIHETKTTRKIPPKTGDCAHRLQVGLYSLAKPEFNRATLDYLHFSERAGRATKANAGVAHPTRTIRHLPVWIEEDDLKQEAQLALHTANYVFEQTQKGIFPRNPTSCVYWGRACRYLTICMPWRTSKAEINVSQFTQRRTA